LKNENNNDTKNSIIRKMVFVSHAYIWRCPYCLNSRHVTQDSSASASMGRWQNGHNKHTEILDHAAEDIDSPAAKTIAKEITLSMNVNKL